MSRKANQPAKSDAAATAEDEKLVIGTDTAPTSAPVNHDDAIYIGTVKVLVKYPADYTGGRYLKEGVNRLSAETAEMLVEKGIASLVEEENITDNQNQ